MSYLKLNIFSVAQEDYDLLCSRLFELGAEGISEKLDFTQESQQYDPVIHEKDFLHLEAYFNQGALDFLNLEIQKEYLSSFECQLSQEEDKDWMEEWKKYYKAFQVEKDLWIYPSWHKDQVAKEQKVILIYPGLAFGTGTHATTQLCLKEIWNLQEDALTSALDLGAGTGVLSVALSLKGFKEVTAVEIDGMARENCKKNLELNDCSDISVLASEELPVTKEFDLVVANIIDGVLMSLQKEIRSKKAKRIILSGILRENEEKLVGAFVQSPYVLVNKTYKEEWVCLHLKLEEA